MGEQPLEVDARILEAARGDRRLATDELNRVLVHVARAGFDPSALETVRARLTGLVWHGRTLQGTDRLPPAEAKFLWHVVTRQEWPAGTALDGYVQSVRRVILDPTSGVVTNRYQGEWSLAVVRESRELRGPRGYDWMLVQYRVARGHWTTAFQPRDGLEELQNPGWSDVRWLRQPTRSSVQ